MQIYEVTDPRFKKYGRVVKGVDFTSLIEAMENTPVPDGVEYEPSVEVLEAAPAMAEIQKKCFGELPIQIGYCNGHNVMLNAVEYHRSSEINVAATDAVLMLGCQQDITEDFTYDTSLMEAFKVPKGVAVELYATTLHYAPCSCQDEGFKVSVVLPKDTNLPLEDKHADCEDKLITAKNKWLIGHAEGGLDAGAHIGLVGKNLNLNE